MSTSVHPTLTVHLVTTVVTANASSNFIEVRTPTCFLCIPTSIVRRPQGQPPKIVTPPPVRLRTITPCLSISFIPSTTDSRFVYPFFLLRGATVLTIGRLAISVSFSLVYITLTSYPVPLLCVFSSRYPHSLRRSCNRT